MTDKVNADVSVKNGPIGFARLLPSIIVVFVCALAIPFASNIYMGWIATGVCVLFLIATAKKKVAVMLLLLLLIGTFGLPDGLPMITLLLAMVVGTGTFSWLIAYVRSPYLAIIPVLAYSVTTVITKSWFGSMLALIFAIPALALAISFINGSERLSAISSTSAAFTLLTILGAIFAMLYFRGELPISAFRDIARDFTENIAQVFATTEVELLDGRVQTMFTEEEAYNIALRVVTLAPAILIVSYNAIAFFAQRLQFSLVRATMTEDALTSKMLAFVVSPGAGIVYFLAFLISNFTNSTPLGYAVSTVCQNIFVILLPALMGMGAMYFFALAAERRIKSGSLFIILFVILLFFNYQIAVLLLACFGAYASVALPLAAYLKAKMDRD